MSTRTDDLQPPAPTRDRAVRSGGWWGMALGLAVLATILSSLLFSYVRLAVEADVWPPEGFDRPGAGLPLGAIGILLASGLAVWAAGAQFGRHHRSGVLGAVVVTAAAGVVASVLLVLHLRALPFHRSEHAYASLEVLLIGAALTLLVLGVAMQLLIAARVLHGPFDERLHAGIDVVRLYWAFAVVANVAILGGLLVGARL